VSFQIKALEQELGVRLFRRENNRVLLTEVGQLLFGYAGEIRDLYDRAETAIGRLTQHVGGHLAVGVASVVAKYVMPKPIGAFKKRHPGVSIVVETGNTDMLIGRLCGGHVDLAIVSDPVALREYVVDPWIEDELLLIVPAEHRWASRDAVGLDEVLAEPFILREEGSGSRRMFERYLEEHNVTVHDLNVALTLGSTEAVKAAVEAGAGASVVSSLSLGADLARGALRTVSIRGLKMARSFQAVYPKLTYRKVVVETFVDFCRGMIAAPHL
jgi:DNA-binding transcriptional LysR family regulator